MKKTNVFILISMLLCTISTFCFADVYSLTPTERVGRGFSALLYYAIVVMFAVLVLALICNFIAQIFKIENLKEEIKVFNERLIYYIFLAITLSVGSFFAMGSFIFIFTIIAYLAAFFSLYNRLLKKDKKKSMVIVRNFVVTFLVVFIVFTLCSVYF